MKKDNNIWYSLLWFITGVFFCYITLQFSLFDIDVKLNVPETLLSIGTAIIGLYIANTIQKRLTKNQNQYTYVEGKLDSIWSGFNSFSQTLIYGNSIEVNNVNKYSKEAIHSIGFVKNILAAYDLNTECVSELENQLEELESYILSLPISVNVISLNENKTDIDSRIVSINHCFSKVLRLIQNI